MTEIQWTPVKNITGWGGGVTYTAGKTYTGLPYGQPVYASYVPWSTSLVGFLDAVNDPNSKMYTSSSTYNKQAPYYSVDCSAFVSWAWGLSSRQTTSTIANFSTKISSSSYANAQVGDCLCLAGSHVVLITDITYDSLGAINGIEISESTVNSATYYCCQVTRYGLNGAYSLSDLVSKYFGSGYILYRCNTRDSVTYSHSCAVPLEGDVCASCGSTGESAKMVSAQVTATGTVALYSLPGASSEQVGTISSGTTIEITAYQKDGTGAVWYKTANGYWINSAQTEFVDYLKTVSITGQDFPQGDLHYGTEFPLKGTITAKNPIVSITASILVGDEVEQQISFGFDGIAAYIIDDSELDDEICFTDLAEGDYTFHLVVLEEGSCPAGGIQKFKTLWSTAFSIIESDCAHVYTGTQIAQASCEAPGVIRHICSECGVYYDELTEATGHDYVAEFVPATCIDYEQVVYTCRYCQERYVEYADGVGTDWTESKPSETAGTTIETKTQYRFSEYETTTSTDEEMSGWELISSQWNRKGTDTVQYAPQWPAGFSTDHSLYAAYHNSPYANTETATTKTTVESDAVTGYLYYHWCRGTYTEGPINRKAKDTKQDDCIVFHAFYSTVAPSTMDIAADGSVAFANAECCKDSHWYYNTSVNTQTYTTYENVFTYGRWTDWSQWTDEEYVEDEACKVESRTLYRTVTGQLGDHSWNGGVCTVCGATDPNYAAPTLTGKSFTLSFEDEILVNFYYTVSDLAEVAEHGVLVFNSDPGAADFDLADVVYGEPAYDSAKDRYSITTTGIAAKEMGDTCYYAAYAKLENGTCIYSKLYDYSPKKYALNMLGKDTTSAEQKALCVAMLNYGTAAQSYFDYKTEDLMNASLTEEQKNLVVAYSADLFTGPVKADSTKIGDFAATSTGFSKKSATVSFESAFAINYYFYPDGPIDDIITFYYWSGEDYAAAETLTPANATGSLAMTDVNNSSYWAQVSGIAAKEIDDTYYVAAVYTSGGETLCSGVISYSLSKYCLNHAKDGDAMQELAAATAMYGYYAKAYFSN